MATENSTALIDAPDTLKTPKSVYEHYLETDDSMTPIFYEMADDSMEPIFFKGDLLTIDQAIYEREGDYVLISNRSESLDLIRRQSNIGDRFNYVPENRAYPEMLETDHPWEPECLGPVTSVRRVDGTIETFDLSTRKRSDKTK
jgi:hypothetical protein